MQHPERADVEGAVFEAVVPAVTALLDRLRIARSAAERAALGVEFEARVAGLRDDLERRTSLDARSVEAVMARALDRVAELVRATPVRA